MARVGRVERPRRSSEYDIRCGSPAVLRSWNDLVATQRGPMVTVWEFLTQSPTLETPRNYRLKDVLATVNRAGKTHARWQHKPTMSGSARIWFFVDDGVVWLEQIHTHHPNETK